MIRSQMISFRPQSAEVRNFSKYITLIEEIFLMIKETSSQSFSVNCIASSIRQVVLKNDCLEQKNDLLDFFFLCEKSINEQSVKQGKKGSKNWAKIIESKINQLKGLQALCSKFNTIQLRWGFDALLKEQTKPQQTQPQIDIQTTNIQVEEDIKLKTLYFFKWCKFIEYGKTIKKLRLKQIDDLRKSLTFNMYAVKFSYFHNWRRQARFNASNRQKFNQIQLIAQKSLFKNTVNSFYSLFEIKTIEQKLVGKVEDSLKICKKQWFYSKFSENKTCQGRKAISQLSIRQLSSSKKAQIQRIQYRFLYYLSDVCQLESSKTFTLTTNSKKSEQNYSLLCAKTALQSLKKQYFESKQNVLKMQEYRKTLALQTTYNQFVKSKLYETNKQSLSKSLRQTKLRRFINVLKINTSIKRQLEEDLNVSFDGEFQIQSNKSIIQLNLQTCASINEQIRNGDLFKYLQFKKLKAKLAQKIMLIKKHNALTRLRKMFMLREDLFQKVSKTQIYRQSTIFNALKTNHTIKLQRVNRNNTLSKIYQTNLLKTIFKSMKSYKCIRLSHQQSLQNIQQTIINPKQIQTAFNCIYERKCKIQACQNIQTHITKFITRVVFKKCFYGHIQTLRKVKQMEKQCELKRFDMLFSLLKKNQQYNQSKIEEVKQKAISKLNKAFFLKNLKSNHQHAQKYVNLYYFNLQQRQSNFINSLKQRQSKIVEKDEKFQQLQKFLAWSLMRRKIVQSVQRSQQMQRKRFEVKKYLRQNEFDLFVNSLNSIKNSHRQLENKFIQLSNTILTTKLSELIKKINYEQTHNKQIIESKTANIHKVINYKSFFGKFSFQAKNSYLKRWSSWKRKQAIFEKLDANRQFSLNIINLENAIKKCKVSHGWTVVKRNMEKQQQVIDSKTNSLNQFLNQRRKKAIKIVTQKVKSIQQTYENEAHLINSLKLKYLSKFMRNTLIVKYEKVKEFCAIRSYARNLKLKSFNGLRTMLLRLRDKQNRLKTEQEIIVKVDKALYNSRKSNKLSETIQRFNSSLKRSVTMGGPR